MRRAAHQKMNLLGSDGSQGFDPRFAVVPRMMESSMITTRRSFSKLLHGLSFTLTRSPSCPVRVE